MKNLKFLPYVLFFSMINTINTSFAQTTQQKFEIGIHSGLNDYYGDLNKEFFDFGNAYRGIIGASFMYNINSWLNTGLSANYGKFGHHLSPVDGQLGMSSNMFHGNAQLRLKINNDVWLKESSKWQPYLYLGTGLSYYKEDQYYYGAPLVVPGTDWTANAGLGISYMFTKYLGINYNFNYSLTNHDKRDRVSNDGNDQFMQHTLGIVFQFGKKNKKDADNDGVADYEDKCPNSAGTIENEGCPEIDDSVKEVMEKALEGVQFETGKNVILESSFDKLDAVAEIMKSNKAYKLDINGHTDNTGSAETNMELSLARAKAVKKYLHERGVNLNQMNAQGFGESVPKASNDTPEGRAINRRVEFVIHY